MTVELKVDGKEIPLSEFPQEIIVAVELMQKNTGKQQTQGIQARRRSCEKLFYFFLAEHISRWGAMESSPFRSSTY